MLGGVVSALVRFGPERGANSCLSTETTPALLGAVPYLTNGRACLLGSVVSARDIYIIAMHGTLQFRGPKLLGVHHVQPCRGKSVDACVRRRTAARLASAQRAHIIFHNDFSVSRRGYFCASVSRACWTHGAPAASRRNRRFASATSDAWRCSAAVDAGTLYEI